jgi:hypothetical protein
MGNHELTMPIEYVEGVDNHNVNVGAIRLFVNRVAQTRLWISRREMAQNKRLETSFAKPAITSC